MTEPTILLGAFMSVAIPSVAAIFWFARLEGRVNNHDVQFSLHEKRHDELKDDVKYIRSRIDRIDRAVNGGS